jgi:NADH-quinone oxidoreductase subunit G
MGGFVSSLAAELGVEGAERAPGELGADAERIAGTLKPGSTVIVWAGSETDALVECARALRLDEDGAGLMEVPEGANGRGLREVGCLPIAGPGLLDREQGLDAFSIRDGLEEGSLDAAFLVNADPVREFDGGPAWSEALNKATFVLSISMFEDASTRHANVVFPAESYAEKEGTVTHPDGRLQRLRPGTPSPGSVRPMWEVLAELSARLGDETEIESAPDALTTIASEVPFYAEITHEEIGGTGVRWQERSAASAFPKIELDSTVSATWASATNDREEPRIQVGTYRDLWAAEVTDRSPALRFLAPKQAVELAPADAARLGLGSGDEVHVRSNGTSVRARISIHERVKPGTGFLIEGLGDGAGTLRGELVEITKAGAPE